jgi:hypothetical protein
MANGEFNPFEEGKEWKDKEPEGEDEPDIFENKNEVIEEILDWYLNDTDDSAEFIENVKAIHKAISGKDYDVSRLKADILEMIEDGSIKVYYDIHSGDAGLLLRIDDNLWKEV